MEQHLQEQGTFRSDQGIFLPRDLGAISGSSNLERTSRNSAWMPSILRQRDQENSEEFPLPIDKDSEVEVSSEDSRPVHHPARLSDMGEVEEQETPPSFGVASEEPSQDLLVQPLSVEREAAEHRVHILGVNTTGTFMAHSLASMVEPPAITLVLPGRSYIERWHGEGGAMEIIKGKECMIQTKFDIESTQAAPSTYRQAKNSVYSESFIQKLIITVKATQIIPILLAMRHRLGPSSTLCFLQDTMGSMEDVSSKVFPDPATRPAYIIGTMSHALGAHEREFTAVHYASGTMHLSLVPSVAPLAEAGNGVQDLAESKLQYRWTTSSRSLMRAMTRNTELAATGVRYPQMLRLKLQRLAVDAVLGPMSVMFDCDHASLLKNFAISELMRSLIKEISAVFDHLPELRQPQEHDDKSSNAAVAGKQDSECVFTEDLAHCHQQHQSESESHVEEDNSEHEGRRNPKEANEPQRLGGGDQIQHHISKPLSRQPDKQAPQGTTQPRVQDPGIVTVSQAAKIERPQDSLAAQTLYVSVRKAAKALGRNTHLMLRQVRSGTRTEIDYINGYIVRRGKELGVSCPINELMIKMVKGKQAMVSKEKNGYIPFKEERW